MRGIRGRPVAGLIALALLAAGCTSLRQPDPLPSWNDGENKRRILAFARASSDPKSPTFLPASLRIAAFDVDGTMWVEYPQYPQFEFTEDRLRALANENPEWRHQEPFSSLLGPDPVPLSSLDYETITKVLIATNTGMTQEEFGVIAREWLASARHPRFERLYTQLVYQPMLELHRLLRDHGFQIFIVTAGDVDFVRAFSESAMGVAPDRVVGTTFANRYRDLDGVSAIDRLPEMDFLNVGPKKPVAIAVHIGQRPLIAVGNSDGDREMLEYAVGRHSRGLGVLIHHDDPVREYDYDRDATVGTDSPSLDDARSRGWVVVSIRDDWSRVFSFDPPDAPVRRPTPPTVAPHAPPQHGAELDGAP